jgi:glycosyltransferase involved in cell wall biosynthesis
MDAEATKKWLIVAHCFNMDGRAASQTITDRLPLLMERGVMPVVVSAPTGVKDRRFPHCQVFSPAPSGFLFEMRHIIAGKTASPSMRRLLKALLTVPLLPFLLIEKLFINLDSHWSWFLSASLQGWRGAKKIRPALVYSTAGPSSTHLTGYLISRMCGLPWIAEVHDPLIMDVQKRRYQRYRFHRWLEQLIFKHADAVIYFTEKALASAENRTGVSGKGHVLRPGASPPPVGTVGYEKRRQFHLGHFGSLADDRNLGDVFNALNVLKQDHPRAAGDVVLDVYGSQLDRASRHLMDHYDVRDMVHLHGRIEHDPTSGKSGREQVVEEMHRCDVLVLMQGDSTAGEEYIPSKLYEYLLTRRPVLGIVLDGSEADRMLKEGGHVAVRKGDVNAIVRALKTFLDEWENGGVAAMKGRNAFTIEKAVDQLIHITESLN